ncbi:hypothetical protein [Fodinibius salinus]|uniref:hypothetical protein n=1 Tax=Fodinibius salinus TaxID=860790 RepID=UPI0011E83A5A|nr:hypothetical protein [Fodinibius salinus]
MWQRFLRLLTIGFNAYSFYSNPVRFIVSILCVILVPYLAYIFWGTVIVILLAAAGIYLIYRIFTTQKNTGRYY